MDKKQMDKIVIRYLVWIVIGVLVLQYFGVFFSVMVNIWSIATPLILGAVIAYILNVLMRKVERFIFPNAENKWLKKSRRIISLFLSLFIIVTILGLVIGLVIPELGGALNVLKNAIPPYIESVFDWIAKHSEQFPELEAQLSELKFDWDGIVKNIVEYAKNGVAGLLNSTFSFVGILAGGVVNFVIAFIFALYILLGKEHLSYQLGLIIQTYIKPAIVDRILLVAKVADEKFSSFIIGQCTEAVILGTLCALGMALFQLPYAPMIGAFIGFTALIPVVGAYLGGFVGVFMILTVDPMKAIFFLLFLVVLQQVEGNLIYPRVVGSSIGLPGIWVLTAVTIGGGISGILGMLLGVPVAATIYKLLKMDVHKKNGIEERQVKKEEQIKEETKERRQAKEKRTIKK